MILWDEMIMVRTLSGYVLNLNHFYACVIQKTLVGILVKGLPGAIWLLALLTLQMSLSILI